VATIFRCDRCKETFDRREDVRPIELERSRNDFNFLNDQAGDPSTRELCEPCYRVIWNAMNPPVKEAKI
jgi:hypothetical protein